MKGFVIEDGTLEDGYIAEESGIHPALRFRYQPMLHFERDAIASRLVVDTPEKMDGHFVTAIHGRLKEWSAGLPLEPGVIRRLRPLLLDRVYNIISGARASDPDPENESPAQDATEKAAFKAAVEGRPPGDLQQEEAEKNSETG